MAAIFASMLIISLGLCGANFAAFVRWGNYETSHAPWWPSTFLVYTGFAELVGIFVGGAGLLIVACIALVDWAQARLALPAGGNETTMKMPSHGRTGLAQTAAILATVLTISMGLCGANFFAFARWGNYETYRAPWWPSSFLIYAGIVELIAILVSGTGLLIVVFIAPVEWVKARFSATHDGKGKP